MGALIAPSAATRRFLEEVHGLYIDGRIQVPSGTQPCNVYNPADGEQIGAFLPASVPEADAAVQAARRAFRERRWMGLTPSARGQVLWRISELLERDADEFAQIETLDCGKLLNAARHGDVLIAAESFRYHAGWCTKIEGSTPAPTLAATGEYACYTQHQPLGVAVLIVPWNGPLSMTCWKLAPALAAGCCVVIKPPEQASLSVLRLARTLEEAGVPPGVVNIVTGPGATVGDALCRHPEVNKISFTGSGATGRRILAAANADLKRVTLELGGKSAALVFADADLERAADGVSCGIFGNAGPGMRGELARLRGSFRVWRIHGEARRAGPCAQGRSRHGSGQPDGTGDFRRAPAQHRGQGHAWGERRGAAADRRARAAARGLLFRADGPRAGTGQRPWCCARRSSGRCCALKPLPVRPKRSSLPTTRATHSPGACGRAMWRARTGWPRPWMRGFSG